MNSSNLLTAAKMAKQQGLTKVLQQKDIRNRAMAFVGDNGAVLVMPMTKNTDYNVLDTSNGEVTFDGMSLTAIKTPSTLKGIETARETLGVLLPNLKRETIESLIGSEEIKMVDGKVVYTFPKSDISKVKEKAKDPNTYNALEDIENNGLVVPMSPQEAASVFAESTDYHIGEAIESNSEAQKLVTEVVLTALNDAGVEVVKATDKQTQAMLDVRDELSDVELMTVYHGSPSLFEEFDHSHMGEGEGAQAHGWGTYVTKSTDTAKSYARMGRVSYTGPKPSYGSYEYEVVEDLVSIMNHGNSFDEAIKIGRRYWNNLKWEPSDRAKRAFLETLRPEHFKLRNLYSVEIPEDNGSNYLYETGYTDSQIEKISEACEKEEIDFLEVAAIASEMSDKREGARLYKALTKAFGSDKAASEFLSRAGFVGIKYDGRRDGECYVIFNESDAKITDRVEFYQTPNGTVYGWTDGKKIYLTEAGMNPNTPVHEYTHIWARAMMQKNPKGWQSIKDLLRGTPVWNEVINDTNYKNIQGNEDAVASEVLSRISGRDNAAKLEQMAQQMLDEAKGTMRKVEARGLIQNIKDALNQFWSRVGKELFKIEKFNSIDEITDRVLYDLVNKTDLGELNKGNIELQALRKYTDRSRNNIAKEPNQEFRNEVAYEIMRRNFQYSGQDVVFANKKAYLVSHPESKELGISAGYSIEKVLDLNHLSDEQRKEAEKLLANYNGDWRASVVSIESMWPRSERINSNLRSLNNRRSEGNNGLLADRQGSEGTTSERGNRSSNGNSGHSEIGDWTKTVYDGSRERRIVYRDELDLEDDSWDGILARRSDIQNASVSFLVGPQRNGVIERAVTEEAAKLGVTVTYKTREEMPKGHENDKGYYNTKTGEIVICTENASSINDAIQTILHEAVAHKGLRQLMGDRFDEFINRVYDSLDAETKTKVDKLAADHYKGNKAVAMEEYMATLAESTDFKKESLWDKIKSIFEDIINAILGRNDIKIGDNELRYILRASYNNMVNPRNMETVRGWAQDQMMREEYKINEGTPEIMSRTGVTPEDVWKSSAKQVYENQVERTWQEFQRQFQDAYQPVRIGNCCQSVKDKNFESNSQ